MPASIRRAGAMVDGMVNKCELSINVVRSNKPKMLSGHKPGGLSQKATERVQGLPTPLTWASGCSLPTLPADREDLNHPVTQAEHGKPVSLPAPIVSGQVGRPQGQPTVVRVEENGKSECRR